MTNAATIGEQEAQRAAAQLARPVPNRQEMRGFLAARRGKRVRGGRVRQWRRGMAAAKSAPRTRYVSIPVEMDASGKRPATKIGRLRP